MSIDTMFYSKENMECIKKSMQQLRENKIIQKTMEELEEMEWEEKDDENS